MRNATPAPSGASDPTIKGNGTAPASGLGHVERLLWDLPEAAFALNISGRTLKRMASGDELPEGAVVHLGRRRLFSRKALETWISEGCPPVQPKARGRR